MSLNRREHLDHLRRCLRTEPHAIFRGVVLPPRYFAVTNPAGADVLLTRRVEPAGFLVLLGENASYVGGDPGYRQLFATPPIRGWRFLAALDATGEEALRRTDELLGLAGAPPRLLVPKPPPTEIIAQPGDAVGRRPHPSTNPEDRFGMNLVAEARARRIAPPLHREKEIDALIRIVSKAGKNAACLIGEPGVGKTAVVEGLAVRIARGQVPPSLQGMRILDVNLSFLGAGTSFKDRLEVQVKEMLDLARNDRRVVLFLDEVHVLSSRGGEIAQMVKADLGRGRIRCIGATTFAEYRLIEGDAALARRFQTIPVSELMPAQTIDVLRAARGEIEKHHAVTLPEELLEEIVSLTCSYLPDRTLPDKALDLLDETCAAARLAAMERTAPRGTAADRVGTSVAMASAQVAADQTLS